MNDSGSERTGRVWFPVAAVLLATATLYPLVLYLAGGDSSWDAAPVFVLALVATLVTLAGWVLERRRVDGDREELERRAAEAEAGREEARARIGEAEAGQEEAQARIGEAEAGQEKARARITEVEERIAERDREMERERSLRSRIERARRAEKEWASELRGQIMEMHREHGALGGSDGDVRSLVLHTALVLLEADKGLLLSREDRDEDGMLDFVCSEGFDNDPCESAVAQRFSREVLERDSTVREASQSELEGHTAADDEIENLVAIPIYIQDQFSGVVVAANKKGGFEEYDDEVLLSLGDHAGAVLQNSRLHGELRGTYLATVRMLAEAIKVKDPFLRGHSEEVSSYVASVAERLGMAPGRREELVFGSLLHDVGKIGISERILLKPGPLSPEEQTICRLHPRIGYRLVRQVPALEPIAPAVLYHHERFDGDGYPSGLVGEQIPLEARVVCVADSFAAMTAERPYRGRMSLEEACTELERCAGTQFDPEIVRVFVEEVRRRPPTDEGTLGGALEDHDLALRRTGDEPVLGAGSFAVTDNLTLLYSHRYLHEMADAEAERAAIQGLPFSTFLVELREIDSINRSNGYAAGDSAIQAVAKSLQAHAIETGGTATRWGGRRLALLVRETDEERAEQLAGQMRETMSGGPAVRVASATWGEGETGSDVLSRARRGLDGGEDSRRAEAAGRPAAPSA